MSHWERKMQTFNCSLSFNAMDVLFVGHAETWGKMKIWTGWTTVCVQQTASRVRTLCAFFSYWLVTKHAAARPLSPKRPRAPRVAGANEWDARGRVARFLFSSRSAAHAASRWTLARAAPPTYNGLTGKTWAHAPRTAWACASGLCRSSPSCASPATSTGKNAPTSFQQRATYQVLNGVQVNVTIKYDIAYFCYKMSATRKAAFSDFLYISTVPESSSRHMKCVNNIGDTCEMFSTSFYSFFVLREFVISWKTPTSDVQQVFFSAHDA